MPIMNITVTAKDIRMGKKGLASGCPIALACYRAGLAAAPMVRPAYVECFVWADGWKTLKYILPDIAIKFMAAYDADRKVAPFRFTLEREGD